MIAEFLLPQPVDPDYFGDAAKDWPVYREDPRFVVCPKGTKISHPDAYMLVQAGSCKPVDDECRKAAGLTDKQIAEHYKVYRAKEKGQLFGDERDRTEIIKA